MVLVTDWVHEKSVSYLTVYFYNKNTVLAAPATGTWQVHDLGSGQVMQAETYILPIASSVELTLTSSINTLVNSNHTKEVRRVTVRAIYGADLEVYDEFDYNVFGLSFVT